MTQHNTTQTVHITYCLILLSDSTPTQNLMQYPVHSIRIQLLNWNYSNVQVCVSQSNKHTHCIWAANGEVMRNKSINYSHAIKTNDNELAKSKAHPRAHTNTSLHGAPSYTLGQFRTSNCVTRYTQTCAKPKLAYQRGLHETVKNKELVLNRMWQWLSHANVIWSCMYCKWDEVLC